MWRSAVKSVCKVHGGTSRTSATAAVETNHVLPFSQIPKLPTVPFLRGGWAYLPYIGKYKHSALHKANMAKYKEYGPIYIEEFSRGFAAVSIHDPKDIAVAFRAEGKMPARFDIEVVKVYRQQRKDLYKNGGLLTSKGENWYEVRSQVQPHMLKPKAIQAFLGAMDNVSLQMVDRIAQLRNTSNKEVPDLLPELNKWALESVALVALDTRLGCLGPNPTEETTKLIFCVRDMIKMVYQFRFAKTNLWKIIPTPAYRRFKERMDYFSEVVHRYLDEAMSRLKSAPADHEATFLEQMLSTSKDPRNIIATITDMFFAGIDTTSNVVALTLYHLARNPEVQEKAFQEVRHLLKDNKEITLQTLNDIPYLKACVKESMRLTPIAIMNGRTIPEDTVLGGYHIPAGTIVLFQNYVTGHQAENFAEPERFLPERFMRNERSHDPFAFLPFGFGPRSCIGRRIAEQELWTIFIRMIDQYRMEYHHEEIEFETATVLTPGRPLRLQFHDRETDRRKS